MANNRPASQSSTWTQEGETLGAAGHAVDGNLEGDFYKGFCSHTNYDLGPWWTVDLGESRTIHTVVVKNRQDCCWKRLSGAEVRVGDSVTNNGTSNPLYVSTPPTTHIAKQLSSRGPCPCKASGGGGGQELLLGGLKGGGGKAHTISAREKGMLEDEGKEAVLS